MGGGGDNTMLIITIAVIGIVAYLIYTGYITNPLKWFSKKDNFGETQIYGVGPTASSASGSGTYGYAQALTYDNQRTPQSDLEGSLLSTGKKGDLAWQKAKLKEGLADLKLSEKFIDPGKALGTPQAYPERMTDVERDLLAKGVAKAMYKAYNVPDATRMGATSFALRNVPSSQENLVDMKNPFIPQSNVGGLAIDPDTFMDMKTPKRSENFVSPAQALQSRNITIQHVNPNIKDYGRLLGFQDPVQTDLKVVPANSKEKFCEPDYIKKKDGDYGLGGGNGEGIGYTTDKVRFLATYKDANCPCKRKVSENASEDAMYAQKYVDCIHENGCTIGNPIDAVYQLTDEEMKRLKELANKYTASQLKTRERIEQLEKLKANKIRELTEDEVNELDRARAFYKEHKKDLDDLEKMVTSAIVRLKSTQYITVDKIPYNACRTTPGLLARDDSGNVTRVTNYVPQNACDYRNLSSSINSGISNNQGTSPGYVTPGINNAKIDAVFSASNMSDTK